MRKEGMISGCGMCALSRRRFLSGCAACVGAAGLAFPARNLLAAEETGKTKIHVIYSLHGEKQERPDWPNKGFEFVPVMNRINSELAKGCPEMEFVSSLATGEADAKKILEEDASKNYDGYLVYQMNCWNKVVQTIATSNKPVLYADFQFGGSGGFLVYTAGFIRKQVPNIGFVASSNSEDLIAAVKCFSVVKKGGSVSDFAAAVAKARKDRTPKPADLTCKPDSLKCLSADECIKRMKESKILAVRSNEPKPDSTVLGIPLVNLGFSEINDAWAAADKDESKAIADRWQKTAAAIIDVSRETLETSAAMYLGMKAVMKKHGANAITINCLGGFYGGHIHAYPCLGFHELVNEGLVGACECDVRSTATMVTVNALTQGRPGYISDPIIDTSKGHIVYAHCVASNRAFGPNGETNPFQIMTHSEDRQGAAVRSILPVGYLSTTLEADQGKKEILMHRSRVVANDPDDRACRTKLSGEPLGDLEKLFTSWDRWGWHRVTCYGDLKDSVYALAEAMGMKVVEEA